MEKLSELERAVYTKLQSEYKDQVISMHTLRLEQVITNAASLYSFNTLEDQSSKTKTEIRLNKNDMLFMTSLGYGLIAAPVTAGKDSKAEIATYANQTIFAAVAGTFDPTDLEVFWKATLTLKVGTTEFIPGLETDLFKYVPQTQKSAATNYDQYSKSSGFVEMPTYYQLRGTDEIKFQLNVTTYAGILVANTNAGFENRVILRPRGFIIRGGAKL